MHPRVVPAVVCVLACLTACTSSPAADRPDDPTPTATARPRPAVGQLLGYWGSGNDDRGPWARFDHDGTFGGYDGCNGVSGTWSVDRASGVVRVAGALTTLVACPHTPTASFDRMTVDGATLDYVTQFGDRRTLTAAPDLDILMHVIDTRSDRLVAVPTDLPARLAAATPEIRVAAAVEAMMAVEGSSEGDYSSLWGRLCGLGTGVASVRVEETADPTGVVVTLTGRGGGRCDLTAEGDELRRQQLAWTVVDNLGVDATTVLVKGQDGTDLAGPPIIPDRAFLAHAGA